MTKVVLVWARAHAAMIEHLVAAPVEQKEMSACSAARYAKGTWEPTPPDVAGIERCQKCLRIGGPGGWGAVLVRRENVEC